MIFSLFFFSFFLSTVTGACPPGATPIPFNVNDTWKCFQFIDSKKPFFAAETDCIKTYQGRLISIPNGFLNTFIPQTIPPNYNVSRYWIGVNDLTDRRWRNIDDNSLTTYFDWASRQPVSQTGSNGCVSVDLHGRWYNDDCFNNYPYVCEVPEVSATSTVQPTPSTTKTTTTVEMTTSVYDFPSPYGIGNQPPFTALIFVSNTSSYENYGGAEEVAQKLKNAGFEFTFFLMGPDVDESKLTNYTTNFVYWRNMSNPQPENWDQVRLQAYGCGSDS
ncbi:hypothetical protein FO519_006285 [Halicephalobus sp. NKZ332]|nr:hypothetical protein FO519_006285 [Halicephalobus sp. NKZ332]